VAASVSLPPAGLGAYSPPRMSQRKQTKIGLATDLTYLAVGLTRAAGVVCPGDGALMATSVLAATTVDWIARRPRPIIAGGRPKK
jgi:hypothetical protein